MGKNKKDKPHDLDYPLIHFSDRDTDDWTLRNAVQGVQIFGGIGSGKSSGSGKTIAHAFLRAGFGGLVLTSKVDETARWLKYAKDLEMLDRIVIFGPRSSLKTYKAEYPKLDITPSYFNPLMYENDRPEEDGGGETRNIVDLLLSIIRMGNRTSGTGGGGSSEPFWDLALERCLIAAIDLLKLAKKGYALLPDESQDFEFTVGNIVKIVREAPRRQSGDQIGKNESSYTIECRVFGTHYLEQRLASLKSSTDEEYQKYESEVRAYNLAESYFMQDLPNLSENTRSSILEMLFSFASPFMSGLLADYFAQGM